MNRSFCLAAVLLAEHPHIPVMVGSNFPILNHQKLMNFKEFRFKESPVYAELPIDENPVYNEPVAVKNAVFSKVPTEPLTGKLHFVCASEDCLTNILDLDPACAETEEFIDFIAGRYLPDGGLTVCHRYGGYQFGFWADQLGDGRAHILGEYVNRKGESWQPQLKGSGETPYSRFGDGRAVLRSSIREMIASEACHHLGIPTTRAAALVVSDDHKVWRDKSYMGHARQERAAIVARVAPAWYRIGSLEILLKRREPQLMTRLVDHVIQHYFPEIDSTDEDKYLKWFTEVAHRNLDLVAKWQGFGFAHGVLNTDNVSLLGLTLDYGPYGFMDYYYPRMIPNTTDDLGRYCYKNQPEIMLWNLEKFAECVEPLLTDEQKEKLKDIRGTLEDYIKRKVLETFIHKLGLAEVKEGDDILVHDLLEVMQTATADYTATFRQLAKVDPSDLVNTSSPHWSLNKLSEAKPWPAWVEKYQARVKLENVAEEVRRKRMLAVNPAYVPRNWMLQEAIADAEKNDFEKVRFLLKIFENPYEENEEADNRGYSSLPPTWSYGLKVNCSS